MEKAYELVRLDRVWQAAILAHAPLDILRLEMEAFAAMRLVVDGGAVADGIVTLSAILAGVLSPRIHCSWSWSAFATNCSSNIHVRHWS